MVLPSQSGRAQNRNPDDLWHSELEVTRISWVHDTMTDIMDMNWRVIASSEVGEVRNDGRA